VRDIHRPKREGEGELKGLGLRTRRRRRRRRRRRVKRKLWAQCKLASQPQTSSTQTLQEKTTNLLPLMQCKHDLHIGKCCAEANREATFLSKEGGT
jgi:hypothetical protein